MRRSPSEQIGRRQRGVTLIEICVVLAIVAILYAQASPSFSAWTHNAQIRTATESLQNGLQLARAEAIRRNRSVMFWLTAGSNAAAADWLVGCATPSGAGAQPEAPGDCPGWLVANGVPALGPPYNWIQRQAAADQQTPFPKVTELNGATWVTFSSLGLVVPNANGNASITQIDVTDPSISSSIARPLRVVVSGGQIRMCDPNPALIASHDPRGC
jgi:type IV fimbrial biogenesis protein FimT